MTRRGGSERKVREREARKKQGHGKDTTGGKEEQAKHLPGGGHGTTYQKHKSRNTFFAVSHQASLVARRTQSVG